MNQVEARRLGILRLVMIPGLGPRRQRALLDRFGDPDRVLRATVEQLERTPGIGRQQAEVIVAHRSSLTAQSELARCRQLGIKPVMPEEDGYPEPLRKYAYSPLLLFTQGTYQPHDQKAVAIVGSRRCSTYGRRQATRLAMALAESGYTIVSGLARGIDAAAHQATLEANGRTIAVLASGLESIYPPEHQELARAVARSGMLVSETPTTQTPSAGLFPQRNRLISALAQAVIVIEATRTSGTLHTVRHALDQGRDVFAVPGRVDSPTSAGCHDLIRDGAVLTTGPEDVLAELNGAGCSSESFEPTGIPVRTKVQVELSAVEKALVEAIEKLTPAGIDQVLRSIDQPHQQVLATLTVLELKGVVQRMPGGFLELR